MMLRKVNLLIQDHTARHLKSWHARPHLPDPKALKDSPSMPPGGMDPEVDSEKE